MKNILFISAALLFFNLNSAKAQNDNDRGDAPASTKVGGFSMNFGGGSTYIQNGGLDLINKHLQNNNYALIPTQLPTWNLDLIHVIYNNTVFNMGIGGIAKRNTVSDSSKTTFSGTTFNISLGHVIFHSNKLIVYPMVGGAFGSATLHSHYSGFTDANDISGTNTYRAIDLSLNFDYIFRGIGDKFNWTSNTPNFHGSGLLSFTVGYTFCPVNTFWNDDNFDISNRYNKNVNYPVNVIGSLTSSNFSMFYATIKLGFGAFSKK